MAYFSALGGAGGTSATITVTYSEDFYGTTITATNGTTTLTKTATSSGTLVFDVSEGGTWVVSGTVEGATYSEQVDVFFEYTVPPLVALPDGSTALPVNDIQMWLKCAGIRDKTTYTTLADVLADTDTFIALCADSNACNYMARSTTWASGVAADSTAMLIVGKYNYCANKLLSNSTWATAIGNSTYFESVLNVKVPTMTSNTTPSGTATASSEAGANYAAWKAFDSSEVQNNYWQTAPNAGVGSWIQYEFTEPVEISKIMILPYGNTYSPKSTKIQAYVDGSWEDIATGTLVDSFTKQYLYANTLKRSTKVRAYFETTYGTTLAICQIQFYGRTDNANYIPLVPRMTSNTTPSGEVVYSSQYTGQEWWKAFGNLGSSSLSSTGTAEAGYVGYKFTSAKVVNRVDMRLYDRNSVTFTFNVQGSDTGNSDDWHDIATNISCAAATTDYELRSFSFENSTAYLYVRIKYNTASSSSGYSQARMIQFYSKQAHTLIHSAVEDSIFYMDDGSPVALCGIPVGDTIDVDLEAYKGQTLTLVSTVAKDPTNLSNDFSMNVRITPNITEIYLMPIKSLYWWGYESSNLEDITSANGWTGYSTLIAPDHNINSISKGNVNYNSGIGSKTAVSATSAYCIGYGVGDNTSLTNSSSKALSSYIKTQRLNGVATPALASITGLTGNTYINVWGNLGSGRNIFVNALWFE